MSFWLSLLLVFSLILGFSYAQLLVGRQRGLLKNLARFFLVFLLGAIISALTIVLVIVAVWPPFSIISLLLPGGFILLLIGGLVFGRSANLEKSAAGTAPQPAAQDNRSLVY